MWRYAQYYEGEHQRLAFSQARFKAEFREVFENWRDNFCGLIIDSATERMAVEGFRIPDSPGFDIDARDMWQRSSMDVLSNGVHLDAMIQGRAYVLVWEGPDGEPLIQPVSAEEMVVQYKAGSRTELEAAARFFLDDWGAVGDTVDRGVRLRGQAGSDRVGERSQNAERTRCCPGRPLS
ncbi:phage portal protein [Streptomyces stramineus]